MNFRQLYSSSRSNLYLATTGNGKQLLLECGISWQAIQKALNYDLTNIVACCLTHEHHDHSKAIKDVIRAGIDVYASRGTLSALSVESERRATVVADGTLVRLDDFEILAFSLNHDAVEALGFIVRADQEYLFFVPDASHITQKFNLAFNIIAIECSFDKDVLQKKVDSLEINEQLAKRLLTSHMEKQATIRYLADFCDLSHCREIHLLHMGNINKEQTRKEIEQKFFIDTRIV